MRVFVIDLPAKFNRQLQNGLFYAFHKFLSGECLKKPYADVIKSRRKTARVKLSAEAEVFLTECLSKGIFSSRTQAVISGFQYLTELPEHIRNSLCAEGGKKNE